MGLAKEKRNTSTNQKLEIHKQPKKEWEEFSHEERMTNEVATMPTKSGESSQNRIKNNRNETGGF